MRDGNDTLVQIKKYGVLNENYPKWERERDRASGGRKSFTINKRFSLRLSWVLCVKCGFWNCGFSIFYGRKVKHKKMEPAGTHALTWWLALSMIDVLNSTPHPRPIVMGRAARNSEKNIFHANRNFPQPVKTFSCWKLLAPDQFPFAVAFSTRPTEQDFVLFCGGSLITQSSSSSWAISSAHCFHDL